MKARAPNFWRFFCFSFPLLSHVWALDDWALLVSNGVELALCEGFRKLHLTALIKVLLWDLISSSWWQKQLGNPDMQKR